jgi:metallo-beta-lactamase family protein
MTPFTIQTLGGGTQVTGSCHLLRADGINLLVDCGLVQGRDQVVPMEDWPVAPSGIDYVFLTHAHIDHIGRLPELIRKGFHGEIIATHGTVALTGPMLRDAMGFSTMTASEMATLDQTIDSLSWGFEYDETFELKRGLTFRLSRAGHILGSCFVRFEHEREGWSIIFSGDLGAVDTPILPDPDKPEHCDVLVLESTYGDRVHEDRSERTRKLGALLERALGDGGKVFIPAFALGRAQELLYELDRLRSKDSARTTAGPQSNPTPSSGARVRRGPYPVFLDTPLGIRITAIYHELREFWDVEARTLLGQGDDPMDFECLYAVKDHRDHLRLVQEVEGPCVIVAGSGMCTGGRIVDHLAKGLSDPRNDIFFVGYQASGTAGREITEKAGRPGATVRLNGETVAIRARIHRLTGYSAHADRKGLLGWVEAMDKRPGEIRLVHGEPEARRALADALRSKGYDVADR